MEFKIATRLNNIGAYNVKGHARNTNQNIQDYFLSDNVSAEDKQGIEKK